MCDKELVINNAKNKFNGELLSIVLEQIDTYFNISTSGYKITNKYTIGNNVVLNKNHLLHGIGKNIEYIETISKRGIVSPDYYGEVSNHAFCYESAFWTVSEDIKLSEYIKNYSGIVAKYNDKYETVPYGKLDNFVEKMKSIDHWLWTAESSMEIRFMPSLAQNNNQIGFILNLNDEKGRLLRKNSVFKNTFNKEFAYEFINDKAKEKYIKEGFTEDFFYRADYIIFGIPVNYFEGIIVGRLIEQKEEYLTKLKSLFPNCYICNLDGVVIKQ